MGKPDHVAIKQEFTSLEQVLNQTSDDASACLKLLKKRLSDYDSRHGNHFINTATSYMRSDMRSAKDTASELKHVSHKINKSHSASHAEVELARNMMDTTAKAMDKLKITARNYDQKNGNPTGAKGMVQNVMGKDDKHKENQGGVFNQHDKRDDNHGGILGMGNKDKVDKKDENKGGFLGLGKDKDKDKDAHHGGGGILSGPDTVESIVKSTLRENFNISPLSHQITAAERSLSSSPSMLEKAKEAMHDVKDKLKGDKTSPTHEHDQRHNVVQP